MIDIKEQKEIEQLIQGSNRILITTRGNPGFDDLGTALAWYGALKGMKKARVDIAVEIPEKLQKRFNFLPGADAVVQTIQIADHFVMRVNVARTKAKELSYDIHGNTLEIRIVPEGGNFTSQDVTFDQSTFSYDLIMVIGASELSQLGIVFENHRELFFNTPIINIDRQASNVRFGHVNAIYLTAASLSEVSYPLLKHYLTPTISTCLLTGLIWATHSFQTPQVRPETLQLASDLIVAGASREDIVTRLYRNKDLPKLKVWGKVLSKMTRLDDRIVYSQLSKDDVNGLPIDFAELVDELVLVSPEAHIVLFFYEASFMETIVHAYARENYDLSRVFHSYVPQGTAQHITLSVKKDIVSVQHEVIDLVREKMRMINP